MNYLKKVGQKFKYYFYHISSFIFFFFNYFINFNIFNVFTIMLYNNSILLYIINGILFLIFLLLIIDLQFKINK